ncbi:MAG: class I tRNA ligase family protein [Bacteroidota bacterium]|nr:class I tRNA ligase family protein [Bacteroidota bacterium]
MEYNFREIEKNWQATWKESGIYQVENSSEKPKFYVLDMFPYPSGAGLHVGHPLGYIASDICARYKRLKGFNVLHPMGFDSFGLPAEQYALETGQHPATTTEKNIVTFKNQLDKIGFCYDWNREIKTSDPEYYRWTQWIFLQLFNSWYNHENDKAEPIETLINNFETSGSEDFSAEEWKSFDEKKKQEILMDLRLAFSSYGEVNWCEALGTVLANDEVVNGVSERGGYPVEKKKMRQWYLRITEYADRLLQGLETVEFSDAMKEMQRNWIGRSEGAEMEFAIDNSQLAIKVYTTRPDTIFGVDFLVLAPEHELVNQITTEEQQKSIDEYLDYVKSRSDRERMSEVKQVTGCFTGAYAINPFDSKQIPIWIAEYVLAGYGTGAIMAVPCGDQRDFDFATHFKIPITNIIGEHYNGTEANPTKEAVLQNSGFLNGLLMKDAIGVAINKIEEMGIGKRKVNYRMRDAGFSRQRYWGEPFPIIWSDGIAIPLDEKELPLELPFVEKYGPGKEGEGPLSNLVDWVNVSNGKRETSTMPGYAGSSWYFLRYMDPHNNQTFADRKATDYWNQVDVYIGGTEHAVGHLLYSRLWTKILYDLGYISFDEPYKKLVNQGMITGVSQFDYEITDDEMIILLNKELGSDLKEMPQRFVYFDSQGQLKPKTFDQGKKYKRFVYSFNLGARIRKEVINRMKNNNDYNITFGTVGDTGGKRIPIEYVKDDLLDLKKYIENNPFAKDNVYITENGYFIDGEYFYLNDELDERFYTKPIVEKMSKSKRNVVNPDDIISQYGADTFRMYEMFLGPVEQSKPWDTKGIEGVHRFLKKLWRLFYDEQKGKVWNEEKPNNAEFKTLHKTIKKIEEDTERFSYNTAVSAFMVCVNELTDLKSHKKEILEPLLILLTPYAPHIAEELYHALGNSDSILNAEYPKLENKYLVESEKEYPISINGKLRTTITISLDATQADVEKIALDNEIVQKWLDGKAPKKIIFVKNKMVNVVL